MAVSAMPDGDVVRVPRSETEVTPDTSSDNERLGVCFGGSEAASAKGSADLMRSVMLVVSRVVRIVARVPPLGPELLWRRY